MSAITVGAPAQLSAGAPATAPGTVRVRERVIDKIARETAAKVIGGPRDDVSVEVSEWGGGLAVRVAARLPIPDLDDTEAIRSATPVLERARQIQSALAEELARLTGRPIQRVSFAVTGATVPQRRRVR
ncbi:NTP pyrophosphohydrolase [Microbacterium marinilacus]|uniref:NTP pyrophosphohydrolase n=1 Tax=Microbacterium marinilacus TaxID=415209 RepID=A0ABP7BPK2_9MICO|nr:NTP pyrophosphohydrolase [Microbacterium marinilacus]MBY0690457.1 NTP pyrophosphohydrolase [Microbacterium marinilacus]